MSGYEVQATDGETVYEGETFMECVEVIRRRDLTEVRIIAIMCSGEDVK